MIKLFASGAGVVWIAGGRSASIGAVRWYWSVVVAVPAVPLLWVALVTGEFFERFFGLSSEAGQESAWS